MDCIYFIGLIIDKGKAIPLLKLFNKIIIQRLNTSIDKICICFMAECTKNIIIGIFHCLLVKHQ